MSTSSFQRDEKGWPLTLWVVYWNPKDFPGHVVVRGQDVHPSSRAPVIHPKPLWVSPAQLVPDPTTGPHKHMLMMARQMIQAEAPGVVMISRDPNDDPTIVELWL